MEEGKIGVVDEWRNGSMDQWTNEPMDRWIDGGLLTFGGGIFTFVGWWEWGKFEMRQYSFTDDNLPDNV